MTWLRTNHFYDRVARRLQDYTEERLAEMRPIVDGPNPEDVFSRLAIEELRLDDIAVDIGTGDGVWFANNVAPRVPGSDGSTMQETPFILRDGFKHPAVFLPRWFQDG